LFVLKIGPNEGKHHLRNVSFGEGRLPNDVFPSTARKPSLAAHHHNPHLALASAMLERVRSRDPKYVSTNGALLIRSRLPGD
jgi:hypothetical protein